MFEKSPEYPPLPPDDPKRNLTVARPEIDQSLPHIGVVGDTYTITAVSYTHLVYVSHPKEVAALIEEAASHAR